MMPGLSRKQHRVQIGRRYKPVLRAVVSRSGKQREVPSGVHAKEAVLEVVAPHVKECGGRESQHRLRVSKETSRRSPIMEVEACKG